MQAGGGGPGGYPGDPRRGELPLDLAAIVDARVTSIEHLPQVLAGWLEGGSSNGGGRGGGGGGGSGGGGGGGGLNDGASHAGESVQDGAGDIAAAAPVKSSPVAKTGASAKASEACDAPERPSTPPPPAAMRPVASFTALKDCTAADVQLLAQRYNEENGKNLVKRVLGMLRDQDVPELMLGTRVTLYEHGLQTGPDTSPHFSST